MADREHPPAEREPGPSARVDRHRIAREAAAAAPVDLAPERPGEPAERAGAAPAPAGAPAAPKPVTLPRVVRRAPLDASAATKDRTRDAIRRPALLSDRCSGCGATTKGRPGMITELIEAGPIRALRVVACSACPDRRRRAAGRL